MSTYSLTVVVDSSWQPHNREPMVCAFDWGEENSTGGWGYVGQRPSNLGKEFQIGDIVHLTVVDLAADATPAPNVTLSFQKVVGMGRGPTQSPLCAKGSSQLIANPYDFTLGNWRSATSPATFFSGVEGTGMYGYEQFSVADMEGTYELTVTVVSNGKTFKVDPEMRVGPPGG